jgi:adenosylcobyric acid synthase
MPARMLMLQGTSSSAGKSLLTAAMCRIFARRGLRVAPFKAQNMSNNAAVCPDGSEIGRAQYVQAIACGIEPAADMNPILLKPEADAHSQVVVMGKPWRSLPARTYYTHKQELWQVVTASLDRLRAGYDMVIMEGAGSPVELNLKAGDIVNMAVARYAQSPVLLIGDIDRGGIFAQLLGTLWLLPDDERSLVHGLLVNKFRGDPALFTDGVRMIEEKGGVPVLGVIPYVHNVGVSEEDAVALDTTQAPQPAGQTDAGQIDIVVIHLPHIANFDDFDAVAGEPGVRLRYVTSAAELGRPAAIIIPGTKSTVADLDWLRRVGLAGAVQAQAGRGVAVAGICGGYQMLGRVISDPEHSESAIDHTAGLGLLPVDTVFTAGKATHQATGRISGGPGWLAACAGQPVHGYEIHMGRTSGSAPWLMLTERSGRAVSIPDGSAGPGGRVWGCYLHGIFENTPFRRAWLSSLGWQSQDVADTVDRLDANLNRLAGIVEASINMTQLERIWES